MAKNSPVSEMNEARRKAIGNPNKNKHHKKNGSNYHPDRPAPQTVVAERAPQRSWKNLPAWGRGLFFGMLGTLVLVLILRLAIFPDSLLVGHITSLVLGLSCIGLYFMRRETSSHSGTPTSILNLILIGMGLLYLFMGAGGLYTLFTI